MEAIAYYVDQHMSYMDDTNSSLGWDGAQTFWRTATESASRGCGNDFCGDCEDHAILRMTLLFALGVDDDCVKIVVGPNHAYNVVNYQGKYRIMDYHPLGYYFYSTNHWDAHETYLVGRTGGWSDSTSNLPMNYPGTRGCPITGWHYSTYYCDICP